MSARLIDKVRKLLAVAERPSTPPAEAELASAKAAAIMAEHAIDLALVQGGSDHATKPVTRQIVVDPPYQRAQLALLAGIGKSYRVRVVVINESLCVQVGYPSDLDAVELLFASLQLQAIRALRADPDAYQAGRSPSSTAAYRRAFIWGYAIRIAERIKRATEQVEHDRGSSTEVALRDRQQVVDAALKEHFPRTRRSVSTVSNRAGAEAGARAADRASLGHYHVTNWRNVPAIKERGLRRDAMGWDAGYIWVLDTMQAALESAARDHWGGTKGPHAVLAVDLDGFEVISDPHPGWGDDRDKHAFAVTENIPPERISIVNAANYKQSMPSWRPRGAVPQWEHGAVIVPDRGMGTTAYNR